ncbi:hypothetical protein KFE98_04650 [bacterium SCSIO 12741]|nr:hypothetical protein KFE98_04650 [bacterium SCSIO 12741]
MTSKYRKVALLLVILLFPSLLYVLLSTAKHNFISRPYFGNHTVNEAGDTVYYQVPAAEFLTCDSTEIDSSDLANKILLVTVFDPKDKKYGPRIYSQLVSLQDRFRENDDVALLTISLRSASDSTNGICELTNEFRILEGKWNILALKDRNPEVFATQGLGITNNDSLNLPVDITQVVLLDKKRRIRGYYDGTQYAEAKRLTEDLKIVKAEEFIPRKKKDEQ